MTITTFIVEDNPIVLRGLTEALEEMGDCSVLATSASALDAACWLRDHPREWTLVIVDLFLAGGSGFDVLIACRHRGPLQRAVVLTNYATYEIRERSLALGADKIFDKSTEIEELITYCAALTAE